MRYSSVLRLVLAGGLILWPAAAPRAQEVAPFARVNILNTTAQAGRTIADVVVPLALGARNSAPMLVTDRGQLCDVRPMGARWPDGSLRYLRVDLPVDVTAHEQREVVLTEHLGAPPSFRWHPAISQAVPNMQIWFRAAGQRVAFGAPRLVENGSRVQVYRAGLRCQNSCIWAQLDVLVMHDTPNLRFYLQWGNSNPQRSELHEDPGRVALEVHGAKMILDEADSKLHDKYDLAGGGTGFVLHLGGWLADGQAQCLEGRIPIVGGAPRVRALAQGWAQTGAFGPFGELIPEAPVSLAWWRKQLEHDEKAQARQPWAAAVHGCHPNPSNAGDQPDFGTIVMRPDLLLADPSRLRAIVRSVYQEWCRPTHFREFDLSPVNTANHPRLLTLSGRPHFPLGSFVDRLGKPARYLEDSKIAPDEWGRTYRGHDGEHLSVNYLCALALTTGDRMALQECQHHVELWLSGFTYKSGTNNDKPGAARAVGRSLAAGCWLWLVTGRKELATRIVHRTKDVLPRYLKQRSGNPALLPFVLVPRWDSSRGDYWPPWEESIAVIGFAAVHALFRSVEAYAMAQLVANNIVEHGIGVSPKGWRVGYKVPFAAGPGRPYHALLDPNFVTQRAAGFGLTQWTAPAIVLVARYSPDLLVRRAAQRMFMDLAADPEFVDQRLLEWIAVVPRHLER